MAPKSKATKTAKPKAAKAKAPMISPALAAGVKAEKRKAARKVQEVVNPPVRQGDESDREVFEAFHGEAAVPIGADSVTREMPASGLAQLIPHDRIRLCPLNDRHRPATFIAELADSIAVDGLLQNITVRAASNDPDLFEVYIGGSRWQAVGLLIASGRAPQFYGMPVVVKPATDLEVLRLVAVENIQRKDMHPIEEGENFAKLRDAGDTTENIAALVGKTQRWVQLRIDLATDLDGEVKAAFRAGKINYQMGRYLAGVKDAKRQRQLVKDIERGHIDDAEDLREVITRDLPEVKIAFFDPALYTGRIVEDTDPETKGVALRRDGDGPWFGDLALFEKLQSDAIEAKKTELEGEWAWVEIWKDRAGQRFNASDFKTSKNKELAGAIIEIGYRGEVAVHTGLIANRTTTSPAAIVAAKKKPKKGEAVEPVGPAKIMQSQMIYALNQKTEALQAAVAGDANNGGRIALALVTMALLGDRSVVKIKGDEVRKDDRCVSPILRETLDQFREPLAEVLAKPEPDDDDDMKRGQTRNMYQGFSDGDVDRGCLRLRGDRYDDELDDDEAEGDAPSRGQAAFELLIGMDSFRLLSLFCAMVGERVGSFVNYRPELGDRDVARALASALGVDMAASWGRSADGWSSYLKICGKARLVSMSATMPALMISPATARKTKTKDLAAMIIEKIEASETLRDQVPAELLFTTPLEVEKHLAGAAEIVALATPKQAELSLQADGKPAGKRIYDGTGVVKGPGGDAGQGRAGKGKAASKAKGAKPKAAPKGKAAKPKAVKPKAAKPVKAKPAKVKTAKAKSAGSKRRGGSADSRPAAE